MSITVQITSPPDRKRLVAEVWADDRQLAEVRDEDGRLQVEVYPPEGDAWVLPYGELAAALENAKQQLQGLRLALD